MSVVKEYKIQTKGSSRLNYHQIVRFFQAAGLEVVMSQTGLVCGECHGDGKVIQPGHRGCIVLESDFVPCPSKCDNGRPTDEERMRAVRAHEV